MVRDACSEYGGISQQAGTPEEMGSWKKLGKVGGGWGELGEVEEGWESWGKLGEASFLSKSVPLM